MIKRSLSTAALAFSLVALAAPAQAAELPEGYQFPTLSDVSSITVSGTTATVEITYTCYGGDAGTSLFVLVEQGPKVTEADLYNSLPGQPGTPKRVKARYDSVGGQTLTCNGAEQTQIVTLAATKGLLHPGSAWTLAYIFDSTATGFGPGAVGKSFLEQVVR
jgi:hypothetical protein